MGLKETSKKGRKGVDRFKVVWRYASPSQDKNEDTAMTLGSVPYTGKVVSEPAPGEHIPESHAADWKGGSEVVEGEGVTFPEVEDIPPMKDETTAGELGRDLPESSSPSSASAHSIPTQAARRQTTKDIDVDQILFRVAGSVDAGGTDGARERVGGSSCDNGPGRRYK